MIGIVGAGITGLALHHYLYRRGLESTVFEAADEPGGVIRTRHLDGHVLESGPQRTRLTPTVQEIVEAVGLSEPTVEAQDGPLYIKHRGTLRRAPLSFREAATTDLLSMRGKLRVLLEPLAGPPRDGETVEDYLTRAFGPEFATRFGGPIYAGLYASDPTEMPVEYSLQRVLDQYGVSGSAIVELLKARLRGQSPAPVVTFEGGMGELPRALYEQYPDTIRLAEPVESIRERDIGYELTAGGRPVVFDDVVITTSAPDAATLLANVDPNTAAALRELNYNPLAIVYLHAETSLEGSGHITAVTEPDVTLGVTWNDSLFDRNPSERPGESGGPSAGRSGIYTCFLGGMKTPEAVRWSDDRLTTVAAEEFENATGYTARPLAVHRSPLGMPAYDRSWSAFDRISTPPGIHLCANYVTRPGIPGRIRQGKALAESLAAP